MKTIYIIYTEERGENDLVFDDKFKLLGGWSCNDATWRNEYFGDFMKKLGFIVLDELPGDSDKLIAGALDELGISE